MNIVGLSISQYGFLVHLPSGPLAWMANLVKCDEASETSATTPVTVSWKASTCLNNYNTKIWTCDYAYILYEMSLLKECTLLK